MTPLVVRGAGHDDLVQVGTPGKSVLDLLGVDVLPTGVDHVVDPAGDPQVAVLIGGGQVAGEVPPVADRLRIGVRPIPVAGERLGAVHRDRDLALMALGHDLIRMGAEVGIDEANPREDARTAGAPGLGGAVGSDRERVDLGAAEVVDKPFGAHGLGQPLGQGRRHRRPGVRQLAHRRGLVETAGLEQGPEDRGHEVERADLLLGDQVEGHVGVELRLGDPGAGGQHGRQQAAQAHGVEERHHAKGHLAGGVAGLHEVGERRVELGGVRARHALGPPGGAGGVEHHADVSLRRRERDRTRAGTVDLRRQRGCATRHVAGGAGPNEGGRPLDGLQRLRDQGIGGLVHCDEHRRAVGDAVGEFVDTEPGGERERGDAGLLRGQVQRGEGLPALEQEDRSVARASPERTESVRDPIRPGVPLGVRHRSRTADGSAMRVALRGPSEGGGEVHVAPIICFIPSVSDAVNATVRFGPCQQAN